MVSGIREPVDTAFVEKVDMAWVGVQHRRKPECEVFHEKPK